MTNKEGIPHISDEKKRIRSLPKGQRRGEWRRLREAVVRGEVDLSDRRTWKKKKRGVVVEKTHGPLTSLYLREKELEKRLSRMDQRELKEYEARMRAEKYRTES